MVLLLVCSLWTQHALFLCLNFSVHLLHKNAENRDEILNYLESILNNVDSWAPPSEIIIQLAWGVGQESELRVLLMLVQGSA